MDTAEFNKLCDGWILRYKQQGNSVSDELPNYWAFEKLDDLVRDNPEIAWKAVLNILATDSSDSIIANISAGPIENLLVFHGEAAIKLIENESLENDTLKFSLRGVYQNDMSEDIWGRLQKIIHA